VVSNPRPQDAIAVEEAAAPQVTPVADPSSGHHDADVIGSPVDDAVACDAVPASTVAGDSGGDTAPEPVSDTGSEAARTLADVTPDIRPSVMVVTLLALTAACWLLPHALGSGLPSQPFWLVLPAVLVGSRYGITGALVASMGCGVLAGPVNDQLLGSNGMSHSAWITQALFFVVVSVLVAVLVARIKEADRRIFSLAEDQRSQALAAATERGALTQELQRRASSDPLTGLVNRTAFVALLQQELAHHTEGAVAVLFVDLDDFKTVNDTLGHSVGDDLIASVAKRLMASSRGRDVVARFGGDEFAILLCGLRVEDALRVSQRVLGGLKPPFNLCGRLITVRASAGLAVAESAPRQSVEQHALELLRQADLAMYRAKSERSHGVAVFHDGMQSQMLERLALESDMQFALSRDQFSLDYQPIVELPSQRVTGVEALLRWNHPSRGMVPPASFIPVAEQSGLIVPLTLWVLQQACAQLSRWDADPETAGLNVSVNVSSRLATEPGIGSAMARELHAAGVDPDRLTLEITESLLVQDGLVAMQTMCQLRALGMRLSVDDFGTGYSSLSRLSTLPIDEVKIDQSFIAALNSGDAGRTIVQATVAMARGLGLRVVAEGVETSRQLDFLTAVECDAAQGYLLGRPMGPDLVSAVLAEQLAAGDTVAGLPAQLGDVTSERTPPARAL
jgi:diguanylate cyclase (GGDEF)-like protein